MLGPVDPSCAFFRTYAFLQVIESWMRLLEVMFPSIANLTSIGKSYERRHIYALRVGASSKDSDSSNPRKAILVTGGVHGREWISTSTVSYLLWSAITLYDNEPFITKLLPEFDIIFIPVLNPDGYEYTWQTDRLWRKSRQQTKVRYCRGMDLDHSFGYGWDAVERDTDPCSESYGGEKPFQATEASRLAHWAKNQTQSGTQIVALLDLHSYSQQILYPYAYTCAVDPPNFENLVELAVGLAKAVRLSSGESYTVSSACQGAVQLEKGTSNSLTRLETSGGAAIDWFFRMFSLCSSLALDTG
jgi:extracellular matrix protein 14